ncbi:MAG TPA: hypothetical protein VGP14_06100 [Casimicrobiaceae bacterium]|nr:hypothetical protein [Casimicrobiaceae bacterium]
MSESSAPQLPPAGAGVPSQSLISTTLVVYALFAVAAIAGLVSAGLLSTPLLGLIGLIALIIAYVKRSEAAGTWLQSHYRWLIRTFWFSVLWNLVGWLAAVTLIGIPIAICIWIATTIWVLYRLIRGYVLFNDSKPIPGM